MAAWQQQPSSIMITWRHRLRPLSLPLACYALLSKKNRSPTVVVSTYLLTTVAILYLYLMWWYDWCPCDEVDFSFTLINQSIVSFQNTSFNTALADHFWKDLLLRKSQWSSRTHEASSYLLHCYLVGEPVLSFGLQTWLTPSWNLQSVPFSFVHFII